MLPCSSGFQAASRSRNRGIVADLGREDDDLGVRDDGICICIVFLCLVSCPELTRLYLFCLGIIATRVQLT
jgi:hypothetical protein